MALLSRARSRVPSRELSTLVHIGNAVLPDGLAMAGGLEATIAALTRYPDTRRSMIGLPRVFPLWRRTPHA